MLGVRLLSKGKIQSPIQRLLPPCQEACPLHQDIRDYLFAIATGDFDRSLEIIKKTNPLPFICGTICARPCEDQCRRADVDRALSIRGLKRAAVEFGNSPLPPAEKKPGGAKIAVIGGGPSGLTAAYDLAGQGCRVTLFDKEQAMGGALRHYIPLYRLPDEAMDRDLEEIAARGVKFCYGRELGKDLTLAQLEKEGYRAVLIALGLPTSLGLDLPGGEGEGVFYALPFLNKVKRQGFRFDGRPTVIVIGGGNVALDVARSAVRSGAEKVKVVCLESPAEMRAFPWVIEEAREEGVEFYCSWGPGEIRREGGRITGLVAAKCTAVFDGEGKFNPTLERECRHFISGDVVIFSIGQGRDTKPLSRESLRLDEGGRLLYEGQGFASGRPALFACGEMVEGSGTAVQAMASGRQAARAIMSFLRGETLEPNEWGETVALGKLDPGVREKVIRLPRLEIPLLPPEDRIKHFRQAELGYERAAAIGEARRCLGCIAGAERIDELCANCLACVRICPYGVPVISPEGRVEIRSEQCQSCGLCIGICPAYAIKFQAPYIEQAAAKIEPAVTDLLRRCGEGPALLTITCGYGGFASSRIAASDSLAVVRYPCVSKIDTLHLLKAISLGVDGILVLSCSEDPDQSCHYRDSRFWINRRIGHVRELLTEIGLDPERLILTELSKPSADSINRVLEGACRRIKELGPSPLRQ